MQRNIPVMQNFTDTFLIYVFGAVIAGVILTTFFLLYHWSRYNMKDPVVPFMQLIYFLGLFILVAVTLTMLL